MENAAMLDLCSRYFSVSCVQWMEAVDPVLVSTMFRSISDARRQAKQQPGSQGGRNWCHYVRAGVAGTSQDAGSN